MSLLNHWLYIHVFSCKIYLCQVRNYMLKDFERFSMKLEKHTFYMIIRFINNCCIQKHSSVSHIIKKIKNDTKYLTEFSLISVDKYVNADIIIVVNI